jgi:histone deacetylase 11
VDRPASNEELSLVHTREYLDSLRSPAKLAAALEMPVLRKLPALITAWRVLRPMRWAVRGSVIAAKAALEDGAAVNLSGGYHHAKPNRGEGFCVFSDIALIVRQLRLEKQLQTDDSIAYVDLDAHQGNGVCHQFLSDKQFYIFDMYNENIYPATDLEARRRIDCNCPLPFGCAGDQYLATLRRNLPPFLDSLAQPGPRLAIYNAGTDPFAGDQLGGLSLSAEDILQRDLFVVNEFGKRQIPFVMLLSGGYSRQSYRLIADTVARLLDDKGSLGCPK